MHRPGEAAPRLHEKRLGGIRSDRQQSTVLKLKLSQDATREPSKPTELAPPSITRVSCEQSLRPHGSCRWERNDGVESLKP